MWTGALPGAIAILMVLALYAAGPGAAFAADEGSHRDRLSPPAGRGEPQPAPSGDALMRQLLSDPESQRMLMELQNDPNMQQILRDPELLKAIGEQDLGRIAQDPKIQALQNNDNVRKLIERNK
ncbi:MAG: hypothetical protein ACE5ER_03640 [Nitrospinaceae bacterium]